MTAPVPNAAIAAPPGLTAGVGGPASAGGALAGFEALLAALFGGADPAGVPQAAGAAQPAASQALFAPVDETVAADEPEESQDGASTSAEDATATDPLLALPIPPPAAAPAQTTAQAETGETPPPAWGHDKAKGAPAQPALAHANAHAGPTEEVAAEDVPTEAGLAQAPIQTAKAETPAAPQAKAAVRTPAAEVAASADAAPPPEADAPPPAPLQTLSPSVAAQATDAATVTKLGPPSRQIEPAPNTERAKDTAEPAPAGPKKAAAPGAQAATTSPKTDGAAPEFKPAQADLQPPEAREQADIAPLVADTRSAATEQAAAPGPAPVRGAPETVASLAAQIIKKLDGRSTRFEVELDPAGLGRVDVRVEIGAHGRVTAAMTFDSPQAAADLKSRAGELQRALEQAGFELSGGMSFDVAGDSGQARQGWGERGDAGQGSRGRAFQQALEAAGEADMAASGELRLRRGVTGGVDVRI